jgi:DNA-binding CsgD family transcriptional regulator
MLYGRDAERSAIRALLDAARASRGGVLVLRGQAGVGKSALLDDAVSGAAGMRVLRATSVESEVELPFAALHQLLRPGLGEVDRLPAPQAAALRVALGLAEGGCDNRFLVAVGVLGLMEELAAQSPVLCVIDDAQWLDDASALAVTFTARRVEAGRIAMLFAARDGDVRRFTATGLPELAIHGMDPVAAADLLTARAGIRVPPDVSSRLVHATGGNALALVELPALLTQAQLSGREPLPTPLPLTGAVERTFAQQVRRLPEHAQRLLLIAAADDTSRLATVVEAGGRLDIPAAALDPAERAELIQIGSGHLQFRHPLVRSAIYQGATDAQRRVVHQAIAEVLVGPSEADRRAWHLALAAVQADESVVRELEQTADRARNRGGFEAACTALHRAADLTAAPEARAGRLAGAGQNAWLAGQLARAANLLQQARALTTDPMRAAEIDRLRAWIEFSAGSAATAQRLLIDAARQITAMNPPLAVELLVATAEAAYVAGDEDTGAEVGRIAAALPRAASPRTRFLTGVLNGLVGLLGGEFARPIRALLSAVDAAARLNQPDLAVHAAHIAFFLGHEEAAYRLNAHTVAEARARGAVGDLLFALQRLSLAEILTGRWSAAQVSAAEAIRLSRETNQPGLCAVSLGWLAVLAVLRGDDGGFRSSLTEIEQLTGGRALGVFELQVRDALRWARGLQEAAKGHPESAVTWLAAMSHPALAGMAAPLDRIEAALHSGRRDDALRWLDRLDAFASHTGIASTQACVAHCRALLAEGDTARILFTEALALHQGAQRPFERARTELAFGEFLRRGRRRIDARTHLQAAVDLFEQLDAGPWAERARLELRATGRTARRRDPSTLRHLTPQEIQVARFVARGLPTREVAAQLFLSTRTVDFHLRNVFAKLGISSRTELANVPLE